MGVTLAEPEPGFLEVDKVLPAVNKKVNGDEIVLGRVAAKVVSQPIGRFTAP